MADARTVIARLRADTTGFVGPIRDAGKVTRDFTTELSQAKPNSLDKISDAASVMGLTLTGVFVGAVTAAANFDKQMSEVAAVSDATGKSLDDLRAAALQAGKDTSFSATEAAKAEAELAKAGISTADVLGGGLNGALALAAAGQLDLADAANISAKTMNAFKLSGKDVPHIADVLAASANKSATDVGEMGQALQQSAMVASQFGLTLEDTAGTLAAFADRGLAGSDAGTSLKTMLLALANPAKETQQRMDEMGISAYDAQGRFIGLAGLAQVLQDKLGGLTDQQRQQTLAQIFGSDAVRAATVLYDLGADGVEEYSKAVNDQGAAAEVAAKKTDNLAGDIERLKGSVETLAIESGSGANGGLRTLVRALDSLVGVFSDLPGPVQSALVILAGVAGAGALGLAGWVRLRKTVREALDAMRESGPAGERAAAGLSTATKWAGRAAVAFAALEIASAVFDAMGDDAPNVDRLTKSLQKLGDTNERGGELTRLYGDNLKGLASDLRLANSGADKFAGSVEGMVPGLKQLNETITGHSFEGAAANIDALDQALTQMVTNGNLEASRAAFTRLLQESNLSYDELTKLLPSYTDAIRQAEQSTSAAGQAEAMAKEKTDLLAGGMQNAAAAGKTVKDMFDLLNGAALGWGNAEIAAEAAIDALTASLKENGKTMDVNTEKGRANKSALLDGIDTAAKAAQAKYDDAVAAGRQSTAVDEARQTYGQYIKRLEDTLVQSGMTRDQAHQLIEEYGKMPSLKETTVRANGVNDAIDKVAQLNRYLAVLNGRTVTTTVRVDTRRVGPVASLERWGGAVEHAATGLLREAAVYQPSGPALYAFAEPQTMGEAFIPKNGMYGRSMSILQQAAGWYGATVVPGHGGGGGGYVYAPVYHLQVSAGLGVDGQDLAGQIVTLISRYEQVNGTSWRDTRRR